MKKVSFILFCISISFFSRLSSQISVLLVDDSDDNFGNVELIYTALSSLGYGTTYYNALDSVSGPTANYMSDFDLVIWQTSNDGTSLELWNRDDSENIELKTYLDNGGKLWLGGLDFLYDKYVVAPTTFGEGDFIYDYAGISSYDVQSYGDDGGLGLPLAYPDSNAIIPGLNELTWVFSTLWWADGVTLRDGAHPIYRMGGMDYPFNGKTCAALYDNGSSEVLTYFFDLAVVNNFDMLTNAIKPVMAYFEAETSSATEEHINSFNAMVYPNPTTDGSFHVEIMLEKTASVSITLYDLFGRKLKDLVKNEMILAEGTKLTSTVDPVIGSGLYYVDINMNGEHQMMPIVISR